MCLCFVHIPDIKPTPLKLVTHCETHIEAKSWNVGMLSDGKDFIMSIVVNIGYCNEIVDKGRGQAEYLSVHLSVKVSAS